MDCEKLLTSVVLYGTCLISLSFAITAPELPKMPGDGDDANNDFSELTILENRSLATPDVDDDTDRDETSSDDDDPMHAPLNIEEKLALFEIEFRRSRCSLANISIDARSILSHEARLALLEKDFKNQLILFPSSEHRSFEEKLISLENAVVPWLSSWWNLELNARSTLIEIGFLQENSQRPLSLEERAALSIDNRLTVLETELHHDKRSPKHVRREIVLYGDHSNEIQVLDAMNEMDEAFQTIKRLVNTEGLGANFRYEEGPPLLHFAAGTRCGLEIVRFLLDREANIDILDFDGHNALYHAIYYGNIAIVQLLIERGINIHIIADGQTMLHLVMTALFPSVEIVRLLIAAEVDYNATNDDGQTPLDLAVVKREETSDEEEKKNIRRNHR
jgi:ankyrin repeat protein